MQKIDTMIAKAHTALHKWEKRSQEDIDVVVREIARTVYENAEKLSELTVEETGLGNVEFNIFQDRRKAEIIWYSLKGKKSVGIIGEDKERNMILMAKPVGVVGVVLPVTIPVTNFMANSMFALKCGNSIMHAPHPSAKKTIAYTAELILDALAKFDVPDDLIQVLEEPSKEATQELMSKVNVVVATGGMRMVKAAYSSGRPAYGVGPGNVQAIIDRGFDFNIAAKKIIASRSFNHGIPCASEQAVIVPVEDYDEIVRIFVSNDAAYIDNNQDISRLRKVLFDEKGVLSRNCIGVSAYQVARNANIRVLEETRILLIKGDIKNQDPVFRKERLCPVSMIYAYDDFKQAVEIAASNLKIEGTGHSVAIHSSDDQHIRELAETVYVSRVIVNQPSNFTAGGGFSIGFAPTTTLGCGTWENNILSENLTYKHLMNVTRIGYPIERKEPSSEEIWGDSDKER